MCLCSLEADDSFGDESQQLSNMKRHSEGTFSNDYSKYLEDMKAQDFVHWLMNNKRSGSVTIHSNHHHDSHTVHSFHSRTQMFHHMKKYYIK